LATPLPCARHARKVEGDRLVGNPSRGVIKKMGWQGFSAQFEWDGERWLFRRNCRAAPVEVGREEMLRSIAIHENGMLGIVVAIAAALYGLVGLAPEGSDGRTFTIGLAIGLAAIGVMFWLNRFATRAFQGRHMQGPIRSRMDVRKAWVQRRSWLNLSLPFAPIGLIAWVHWRQGEPLDWYWMAFVGTFAVIGLFDIGLKLRMQRL